jgi:hypothetical protein
MSSEGLPVALLVRGEPSAFGGGGNPGSTPGGNCADSPTSGVSGNNGSGVNRGARGGRVAPVPIASTPLLNSDEGPVVKNGVAAIVVCGNKRDEMRWSATDIAPEPQTGGWSVEERNGCDYYYHHPPEATQRANRHERAEQERGKLSPNLSGSREMLVAD